MNEAFGSINEFKREVSDLSPQHKEASDEIKALVEEVEAQKQDYIEVIEQGVGEGKGRSTSREKYVYDIKKLLRRLSHSWRRLKLKNRIMLR